MICATGLDDRLIIVMLDFMALWHRRLSAFLVFVWSRLPLELRPQLGRLMIDSEANKKGIRCGSKHGLLQGTKPYARHRSELF
jgi:hypothetical protein